MMNIGYREWFSAGPAFWTSPIGMLLSWKIILFFIVLILAGLHDFWLGPRAGRLMQDNPDSPAALRARYAACPANLFRTPSTQATSINLGSVF